MYKSLIALAFLLLGVNFAAPALTLIYNQSFTSGVTPTTQCTAWNTFRSTLLSTYTYRSVTFSGSLDVPGITCSDPTVTTAVANALRTGSTYTGTFTVGSTTHSIGVGLGCGSGCSSTAVEFYIDVSGTCTCLATAASHDLRPDIGNLNWGGIGTICSAPTQTLIVTFVTGPPPPTFSRDTVFCAGTTIYDTAYNTATSPTYSWTGPGGFTATTQWIAIPATPAASGVYSCTVTDATGTSAPGLDTIDVVPLPTLTLGANPSVCYGSSFGSLVYTSPVSSPTLYNITYDFTALAAGFTNITGAAITSSPIAVFVPSTVPVGVYNATITLSNAHCSGPGSHFTVSVNPVPDSITGVTNICTGSIVTLHDVSAGYNWTSSNTAVATIDGTYGVVTAHTIGATIISYTDPSSGCAAVTEVNVVGITGATSVCATDSVMLTATGPGTWSSGTPALATVGSTGFVTGRSTGVATISYTLGSGCIATWVMTVNPLALIVGRDSVCIGSTRNLTDIVGGGTWTTTFPLIASVVADSGKVTGLSVGLTTISYTLPVTGCMTTVDFNVVGYPVATTGSPRACPGTSTTLHDASTGGVWTSYDPSIATVIPGTGVVTGVRADTVDIFYTLDPGCSISTRVTINPLPEPITGNSVMCPYTTDTLHDATRSGRWTTTTPAVAALDTGILTGITGGLAVVSYTLPTSCAVVKIVTVGVAPAPIITYYNGTLYVSGTYATYQWYDSLAGEIHGATSPSIAAANEEYYYVVVTDSAGCVGTSSLFHFNFAMEGVANVSNNTAVNIYPNPTNGMLYIDAPVKVRAVISSIEGKKEIDVTDAKQVNMATLANGMYFVTLYDDNDNVIAVRKVVKQ